MVLEHIIKRVKDGLTIKNPLHSISFYQNLNESKILIENFIKLLYKNKKASSLFIELDYQFNLWNFVGVLVVIINQAT